MTNTLRLVDRLRGIYIVPVNDGAGLLDGKDTFENRFPVAPIQHEAAARIEELDSTITALRSDLASLTERWTKAQTELAAAKERIRELEAGK